MKLFRPERDPDTGAVTLGSVPHAHTDPLRGALIAVAPLLLVPPLFVGVSVLLLGGHAWQDPLAALTGAAWWKVILWAYIAFSCGQASFPSPGDHVGALGGICLAATGVLAVWALLAHGGIGQLQQALTVVVQLMAVPAASAAAGFAVFWVLIRLRAGRH